MSFVVHYGQPLLCFVNRRHIIQTVTISLYRFDGVMRQLWAFAMMGLARQKLKKLNNLRFWKLLGSGTDQGFTPIPNLGVYAILCVWDTSEEALEFTNNSKNIIREMTKEDEIPKDKSSLKVKNQLKNTNQIKTSPLKKNLLDENEKLKSTAAGAGLEDND